MDISLSLTALRIGPQSNFHKRNTNAKNTIAVQNILPIAGVNNSIFFEFYTFNLLFFYNFLIKRPLQTNRLQKFLFHIIHFQALLPQYRIDQHLR